MPTNHNDGQREIALYEDIPAELRAETNAKLAAVGSTQRIEEGDKTELWLNCFEELFSDGIAELRERIRAAIPAHLEIVF